MTNGPVRGSATYAGSGTANNVAVTIPAASQPGDYAILFVASPDADGTNYTSNTQGFTEIVPSPTPFMTAYVGGIHVFEKRLVSGDAGATLTVNFSTYKIRNAAMLVIQGAAANANIAAGGTPWSGTPVTTAPSVTTTSVSETLITCMMIQQSAVGATTWSLPAGLVAGPTVSGAVANANAMAIFYDLDTSSVGATGTISSTASRTSNGVGVSVLVPLGANVYAGAATMSSGSALTAAGNTNKMAALVSGSVMAGQAKYNGTGNTVSMISASTLAGAANTVHKVSMVTGICPSSRGNNTTNAITNVKNGYGVIPQMVRTFIGGPAQATGMNDRNGTPAYANTAISHTFLSLASDSVMNSLFNDMQNFDYMDLWHEPENDMTAGSATHLGLIADTLHLQQLLRAVGLGTRQNMTFIGSSADSNASRAKAFWEADSTHTLRGAQGLVLSGWDWDGAFFNDTRQNYWPYNAQYIPNVINVFQPWAGIHRWMVNENNAIRATSSGAARDADGSIQTAWLIGVRQDCLAAGCEAFNWFESTTATGREYVDATPPQLAPYLDISNNAPDPDGNAVFVDQGVVNQSTASTTISVPIPSNAVAGNKAVIFIATQETTSTISSWTNSFVTAPQDTAASRTNMNLVAGIKVLTSGDIGTSVTITFTTSKIRTATISIIAGPVTGIDDCTGDGVGWTGATGTVPSIVTTRDDSALIICFAIQANTNSPLTAFSTPTSDMNPGPVSQAVASGSTSMGVFYNPDLGPAGSTSVYTSTISRSSNGVGLAVGLPTAVQAKTGTADLISDSSAGFGGNANLKTSGACVMASHSSVSVVAGSSVAGASVLTSASVLTGSGATSTGAVLISHSVVAAAATQNKAGNVANLLSGSSMSGSARPAVIGAGRMVSASDLEAVTVPDPIMSGFMTSASVMVAAGIIGSHDGKAVLVSGSTMSAESIPFWTVAAAMLTDTNFGGYVGLSANAAFTAASGSLLVADSTKNINLFASWVSASSMSAFLATNYAGATNMLSGSVLTGSGSRTTTSLSAAFVSGSLMSGTAIVGVPNATLMLSGSVLAASLTMTGVGFTALVSASRFSGTAIQVGVLFSSIASASALTASFVYGAGGVAVLVSGSAMVGNALRPSSDYGRMTSGSSLIAGVVVNLAGFMAQLVSTSLLSGSPNSFRIAAAPMVSHTFIIANTYDVPYEPYELWTGTIFVPLDLIGWWDGATLQPLDYAGLYPFDFYPSAGADLLSASVVAASTPHVSGPASGVTMSSGSNVIADDIRALNLTGMMQSGSVVTAESSQTKIVAAAMASGSALIGNAGPGAGSSVMTSASTLAASVAVNEAAAAVLTSGSVVVAGYTAQEVATVTITSGSVLTGQSSQTKNLAGVMVSGSTLAANSTQTKQFTASMASASTLSGSGNLGSTSATLVSGSVLAGDSTQTKFFSAGMVSASTLAGSNTRTTFGAAVLTSGSAVVADSTQTKLLAGTMVSASILVGAASIGGSFGSTMTSGSTLAGSSASLTVPLAAILVSGSVVAANAVQTELGASGMVSGSVLTGQSAQTKNFAATLVSGSTFVGESSQTKMFSSTMVSGSVVTGVVTNNISTGSTMVSGSVVTATGTTTASANMLSASVVTGTAQLAVNLAATMASGSVVTAAVTNNISLAAVMTSASLVTASTVSTMNVAAVMASASTLTGNFGNNVLTNSNFEGGTVSPWAMYSGSSTLATNNVTPSPAGGYYGEMTLTASNAAPRFSLTVSPVVIGQTWTLSGWMRLDTPGGPLSWTSYLGLRFQNSPSTPLETVFISAPTYVSNSGWAFFTVSGTAASICNGTLLINAGFAGATAPVGSVLAIDGLLLSAQNTFVGAATMTSGSTFVGESTQTKNLAGTMTSGSVVTAAVTNTLSVNAVMTSGSTLAAQSTQTKAAASVMASASVVTAAATNTMSVAGVMTSASVLAGQSTQTKNFSGTMVSGSVVGAVVTNYESLAGVMVSHSTMAATLAPSQQNQLAGVSISGTILAYETQTQLDADMAQVASTGAGWVRFDVAAVQIESSSGVRDWSNIDRMVASAANHGLKVHAIATTLPSWVAANYQVGPSGSTQVNAFTSFLAAAVNRYSSVTSWEIWNEPNNASFWTGANHTDYSTLLKASYPVVKANNSLAQVVAGGTAGGQSSPNDSVSWYTNLYADGDKAYFDVANMHPYPNALPSLLTNSNYELVTLPSGVQAYYNGTVSRDATVTRQGTSSLKCVTTGSTPDGAIHMMDTGSIASGSYAGASFWVKGTAGVAFTAGSRIHNTSGTYLADYTTSGQFTGKWQLVMVAPMVYSGAAYLAGIEIFTSTATTFWLDDSVVVNSGSNSNSGEMYNVPGVLSVMATNSDSHKPIWATECGFPTGGSTPYVPEWEQSGLLVELYKTWDINSADQSGPFFAYTLRDTSASTTGSTDREDYFGMAHYNGTDKGAIAAFTALNNGVYSDAAVMTSGSTLSSAGNTLAAGAMTSGSVVTGNGVKPVTTAYLNHVTIAIAGNGTSTNTVNPSNATGGGTVVNGTAFTPTAGRFLLMFPAGAQTSYGASAGTPPTGWTQPTNGQAVGSGGLYCWYKASAAGGDTVTVNHNGTNFPSVYDIYEFPAGTTFGVAASATGVSASGGSGPTLTKTTTAATVIGAVGADSSVNTGVSQSWTWNSGTAITVTTSLVTNAYAYGATYNDNVVVTTQTYAATTSNSGVSTAERLMVSVIVGTGGNTYSGAATMVSGSTAGAATASLARTGAAVMTSGSVVTGDGTDVPGPNGPLRTSATYSSTGTTSTAAVTIPAAAVAGDYAILFVVGSDTTDSFSSITNSFTRHAMTGPFATNLGLYAFEKILVSGDISSTLTATFSTIKTREAILLVFPGPPASFSDAVAATSGAGWTSSATAVAPAVTSTVAHDTIIAVMAIQQAAVGSTTWSLPTGYTAGPTTSAAVANSFAMAVFYLMDQGASAGSSGTITSTCSRTSTGVAATFAIKA